MGALNNEDMAPACSRRAWQGAIPPVCRL